MAQTLQQILDWELSKPTKDSDWAEDVKKENLDIKFDYQLAEMEDSHSKKLIKVQKDLDKFENWPDVPRYEITQRFNQFFEEQDNPNKIEGKTKQQWIDDDFNSQHLYYQWKVAKLNQSIERIKKERELRSKGFVVADKNDDKTVKDVKGLSKDKIRIIQG